MTVIVRREVTDATGERSVREEYKSIKNIITKSEINQAEELDKYLEGKFKTIYSDLQARGLLENEKGDLERWYALGEHLKFADDEKIVPPEDRNQDKYIWEAFWHHAPLGLRPGPPNSRTGTKRDHFRECYLLAQIPYDLVRSVGNWSDWVNFLESPSVMQDDRIIKWVSKNLENVTRNELREFTQILRNKFKRRVTEVLSDEELSNELKEAWEETET
jgi:hypothetical protein